MTERDELGPKLMLDLATNVLLTILSTSSLLLLLAGPFWVANRLERRGASPLAQALAGLACFLAIAFVIELLLAPLNLGL